MNAIVLLLVFSAVAQAEIIDRIAVVVGNSVITESEIVREVRLTAFLNQEALDFSPASKRKVADRLIEQRLIQLENEASLYPPPPAESVDQALAQIKGQASAGRHYQEGLVKNGITEQELKAHLQRQLATLRFIDLRFRPGIQVSDEEINAYFEEKLLPNLKKTNPGVQFAANDYRSQIEQAIIAERIDKASDTWLKEAREHTRIDFRPGIFEAEAAEQKPAQEKAE